jgi:ketosteroid isomerase-like protein
MKHLAIRVVVSLLTFAIGIASATLLNPLRSNAGSNSADEQAVLQVERQYIRAHLNADTATLEKIVADDFTISSRWAFEDKAERQALLENTNFAFEAINTENVEVEINGDKAVLTGKASIESREGDIAVRSPLYNFTGIYEKRQGRWQIVSVRIKR